MARVTNTEPAGSHEGLSAYQLDLRDRMLAAPVVPAPAPWRPVFEPCAPSADCSASASPPIRRTATTC